MSKFRKPEESRGYTPPANPEAEQSLLGAVLVRPAALDELVSQLYEEDFYRAAHQKIYHAMVDLYGANLPVDLVSVCAYLKDREQLEGVGGPGFLAGLSEQVGFATNVNYYAQIVQEKAALRRLLDATQKIAGECLTPVPDVAEFINQSVAEVSSVIEDRGSGAHYLPELVPGERERIEGLHEHRGRILGVPTGFIDLDRILAGLQKADLILLAGRPSMGKTALALNISYHAAHAAKIPVAFFSLEMSKEQLVRRLFASVGRIDAGRLRSGNMQPPEWVNLQQAEELLMDSPVHIVDKGRPTVLQIGAQARRLKAVHGIGLVVVDYLQLIRDAKAKSREQEIARISGDLKALAKDLNVPVLALSQLNRKCEERPNKRPQLADLRDSGSLEQDADVVLFLYRDEVYRENSTDKGKAELRVAKQRNGALGLVTLTFLPEFTRFENYAE